MTDRGIYFPIFCDLRDTRVLVAGAGEVARRKIKALVAHGAEVTVVAKDFASPVRRLAAQGKVRKIRSSFRPEHLDGMALAFAATDDQEINRSVAREARRRNIPVNVADSPGDCSFILPAVLSGGEYTLAVSTGGKNPASARAIREFLEEQRAEISVRLERGRRRKAIRPIAGKIYIVGAGPGDPDFLTVRALGLLRSADVVLHDYLVPVEILSLAAPKAKRICFARRGKTAGHGSALKQNAIHEAMARLARAGKSVVRLKSGDPLLFGRGGEEAEYLAKEGIPFEFVPGITAAVGCAAAAGIPLTHRALSSSVTLVAGHEAQERSGSSIDWRRLPAGGTLAVYMGASRAGKIARDLMGMGGFPPETPVAIVENGTRQGQRVTRTSLADLPRLAEEGAVRSPAMLFVGKTASCALAGSPSRDTVKEGKDGPVAQSV